MEALEGCASVLPRCIRSYKSRLVLWRIPFPGRRRDAPTANSSGARAAARARRPGLRRESRSERATPAEQRTVCSARCPRARIVHVSADCSQSHTVLCVSALGAGSMGQRQTTPRPERSETRHVHAHVQVDVTETLSRPRAKRSRPTPAPVFRSEVRAFYVVGPHTARFLPSP